MPVHSKEEKIKEHIHYWVTGNDYSSQKCNCGKVLISQKEAEFRKQAWDNYLGLVRTTSSYLDFLEMKQAFLAKDKEKIKFITEKIKQRTHKNKDGELELDDPLSKPEFPDPATWNKYVIGG